MVLEFGERLGLRVLVRERLQGMSMPAMRAMTGPQKPAAETTWSAGKVPRSVTTAVTRPASRSIPVTVWRSRKRAPLSVALSIWAWDASRARARPSSGVWKPPSTTDSSSSGQSSLQRAALTISPRMPQAAA